MPQILALEAFWNIDIVLYAYAAKLYKNPFFLQQNISQTWAGLDNPVHGCFFFWTRLKSVISDSSSGSKF